MKLDHFITNILSYPIYLINLNMDDYMLEIANSKDDSSNWIGKRMRIAQKYTKMIFLILVLFDFYALATFYNHYINENKMLYILLPIAINMIIGNRLLFHYKIRGIYYNYLFVFGYSIWLIANNHYYANKTSYPLLLTILLSSNIVIFIGLKDLYYSLNILTDEQINLLKKGWI